MKKISTSLGLSVFIFALAISFFLFKENKISADKSYTPEKERFPENVHALKVDSQADEKSESEEFSILDLQVEDLRRQVELLSKKMRESDQKTTEMELETKPDKIENALNTTETTADDTVYSQYEEQRANLSARLMQEPLDNQWAEETIGAIESALETNEELAGIELIQTTCMSTLCKLEINIGHNRPAEEVMQRLSIHRTWKGATTFAINSSGYAEIIFAREGHTLD